MPALPLFDWVALAWFLCAWFGYSFVMERTRHGQRSLTGLMNEERLHWMERMATREVRIVDTQIMASLQNGTAFFASSTLLAIGAAFTLFRATDEVLSVFANLPFGIATTKAQWELKVSGLAIIFVYAFFKFAWAYRLFNYVAVMLGATPHMHDTPHETVLAHARKTAAMQMTAAAEFNRGLRAFFFVLGYLGWFVSPLALILTSTAVTAVLYRRQFHSSALRAARGETGDSEAG